MKPSTYARLLIFFTAVVINTIGLYGVDGGWNKHVFAGICVIEGWVIGLMFDDKLKELDQ